MRLWLRLTLFLVIVSVVPLVVTGLQAVNTLTRHAQRSSEEQLYRDAAIRAEVVGRWIHEQVGFLQGWTELYPTRLHAMRPHLQDGLIKAVYVAMPSAVVVALVDGAGEAVIPPRYLEGEAAAAMGRVSADPPRAQRLVAHLPLTAAMAGGTALGDPYLAEGATLPSVPVAALASVGEPEADEVLLLGAELHLVIVDEIFAQATADLGFALLDGSGEVLAGEDHPLIRPSLVRPLAGAAAEFRYTLDGEAVIGALAPVPGTDWSLVVVRPASVVALPAQHLRDRTVAVLFLSLASALFLGYFLSRSLIDPVERLRDAALEVAEGAYGRRSAVDRRDELGELARAFDHMSDRLAANQREIEAQQAEIEAFNRELQERVERRTAELHSAQDQLVRSGQLAAVAEIGAGLAHELNNPLAGILGLAQVLRARSGEGGDAALLADLEAQAERCREVVATLVRISSGQLDPRPDTVVDLRDVLREVAGLVRGPFRQRGVILELVVPEHPLPARVDPVHASRILAQVLNALRAGLGDGAHLRVEARPARSELEVSFQADRPVAVDQVRRDDLMASGLGLWVARRLLHDLGGRLEALDAPAEEEARTPHSGEPDGGRDPMRGSAWRVVLPGA